MGCHGRKPQCSDQEVRPFCPTLTRRQYGYSHTPRLAEKDTLERVEAADAILDDTEKATLRLFEVGTPAYVFWIRLTIVLAGMRLFTTSSGRLGYGSPEVAKGDAICIFDGARTPHLLRGTTGSDACKLVGEAYVHGMMNGEVESLDFENDWITLV